MLEEKEVDMEKFVYEKTELIDSIKKLQGRIKILEESSKNYNDHVFYIL